MAQRSDELYITSSVYHLLELSSHKGGKANGLRWVLDQIGVAPEETVAFGNADNDIDLLNLAGVGIAVADATDSCPGGGGPLHPGQLRGWSGRGPGGVSEPDVI